jgi:SAM-dependent methyltransferase
MTADSSLSQAVRERYAEAARQALTTNTTSCCGGASGCGQSTAPLSIDPITSNLYDEEQTPFDGALAASLGCGNPTALIELQPGEHVLDLGSGGGLDVLLSARRIAPDGIAYGLDMTPEMHELAQKHQAEAGVTNAEFMVGSIEDIPMADSSVDVVISNCVINLSHDKDAVLAEAYRVLRPGGRFAVSDIVLLRDIPTELTKVVSLWTGCISGALRDVDYVAKLHSVGFLDASTEVTRSYDRAELEAMSEYIDPAQLPSGMSLAEAIQALDGAFASAFIRARKPL